MRLYANHQQFRQSAVRRHTYVTINTRVIVVLLRTRLNETKLVEIDFRTLAKMAPILHYQSRRLNGNS